MALYAWGKTKPLQQEHRVSLAERRLASTLADIEERHFLDVCAYEKRKEEVARQRAQLTAYYEAAEAKKRGAGEKTPTLIPGRVDFILSGIKAEMTFAGIADEFPAIDEMATLELGELIAGFEIDAAIGMSLDHLGLSARVAEARRVVINEDVVFCEETMARRVNSGPRALRRTLKEISDHFRVHWDSDPVYGLPEERWRAIINEWIREFEVPPAVVRYTTAGGYRGEKSRPVIISTRLFREYCDPVTGVAVSPAVILDLRFRKAAGLVEMPALGEPRDVAANFLKPALRFLKKSRGTAQEKSAERLLEDMKAIAPVILAPGGIYAAKLARDRFPGRFFGEQQELTIPWELEDRRLYNQLTKNRACMFTFGNIDLETQMDKLHEVAERLKKGEV